MPLARPARRAAAGPGVAAGPPARPYAAAGPGDTDSESQRTRPGGPAGRRAAGAAPPPILRDHAKFVPPNIVT